MSRFGFAIFFAAFAQEQSGTNGDFYAGPYCGLYCVHTCLKLAGRTVDFDQLACMKYKQAYEGSTAFELQRALEDHGVAVLARTNLSADYLRFINNPVILHARQPGHRSPYEHWLLFLGCEDDQFLILDPPKQTVFRVTPAELLAICDGSGIVAQVRAGNEVVAYVGQVLPFLIALFAGLIVVLLIGWAAFVKRMGTPGIVVVQLIGAVLLGLAFHLLNPIGVGRNRPALALVRDHHFRANAEVIGDADLPRLLAANAVLVDTRLERDFRGRTIPGAVSLPITANYFERGILLDRLPRERALILFCQSENCPWSREIASYLKWRGNENVYIYGPGFAGWRKANQKQGPS